jgi:hypothetical protein
MEKQSIHVYTFTHSTTTMKHCVMYVQICQNPVSVRYNRSAAIAFATHLIHKLPLLFDLPVYFFMAPNEYLTNGYGF